MSKFILARIALNADGISEGCGMYYSYYNIIIGEIFYLGEDIRNSTHPYGTDAHTLTGCERWKIPWKMHVKTAGWGRCEMALFYFVEKKMSFTRYNHLHMISVCHINNCI